MPSLFVTSRRARWNISTGFGWKNAAIACCSGLRTDVEEPRSFTSLYSVAYFRLVSAFGPLERNCDVRWSVNGLTFETQANGSLANAGSVGRHSPGSVPTGVVNGTKRPSPVRSARIAAAAAAPAAIPSSFAVPSGIAARAPAYRLFSRSMTTWGSAGTGAMPSPTSTLWDAVATAASMDASGDALGRPLLYG